MEFTQVSEIAVEDSVVSHDASRAELEAKDSTIAEMRRMQNALESELELKIKKVANPILSSGSAYLKQSCNWLTASQLSKGRDSPSVNLEC